MPMYEFVCRECELKFEELIKLSENNTIKIAKCPRCNSESDRVVSASSFSVVGSTNKPIDSIIGADADKRWNSIYNRKIIRDKKDGIDSNIKNAERISGVLEKQRTAYDVIDRAKKSEGITKRDELTHALKG